jgi:hypothetical protein
MALIHYSRGARLGSVREKFPGKIAEEKSALQWASEWVANHKLRAFGTLTNPFPLLLTRASFTSVPFPLSPSSLRLRRAVLGAKSPWLVCA